MRRWLWMIVGIGVLGVACAGSSVHERVEASMRVTGTLTVTAQGAVAGYVLDRPERLPPVVTDVIAKNVTAWRFQPVLRAGQPVAATAKMSLRLLAHPLGEDHYRVSIASAYFGAESPIKRLTMVRPSYPPPAIRARVEGTVYLVLRLDRAGHVQDACAQQVNLRVLASDPVLARWRQVLADASLDAARQWTFSPAALSDPEQNRIVHVPVDYHLRRLGEPKGDHYGQWQGYVPGPIDLAPWFEQDQPLAGGADALPDDGVYGRSELSLLTPLGQS